MKILFTVFVLLLLSISAHAESIRINFDKGFGNWDEKIFNGQSDYQIVTQDGHRILQSQSRGNASALIYWQDIDPHQFPKLRWRWKIDQVLQKGHAGIKGSDDYPARIYIIFDSWLPNFARSINYIWASQVERDRVVVNPYYRRSIMLTVESGNDNAGHWVTEERDLIADYRRVFGGDIPQIKAVAVMTDGDDTGESTTAWYDWIEFVPVAQ